MKLVHGLWFVVYSLIAIGLLIQLPPAIAVGEPCILESDASKAEATGLASAPITGSIKVNVAGQKICVENERAGFVSYKLPTYDDLKSIYYDQSKVSNKNIITSLPGNLSGETLYLANGNLDVNSSPGGGGSVIFFVNGNLNINSIYTNGSPTSGTVFVVKGDINIKDTVDRIDAVLISQGTIYTAGAGCATTNVPANQLLVNGSLISLNSANPIKFCRKLTDNTLPAEKIHYEPKYLVILKDIFSDTYQKWSEIQ